MDKKIGLCILIFIIIIASFLCLFNLSDFPPGLYPDEAMNGNNALEAISTGDFKVFYPENNGREGLFMNIQAIFLGLFGNEIWALRLVSALFGIFIVLGVYFLTKELFANEKIALLSAFFIATSFWIINFSRIGFRAIMAPFFLVWGVYFLLKSFNSEFRISNFESNSNEKINELNKPKFNQNSKLKIKNSKLISFSIIGGIFYGLGFYSYIAYRATPLLILIVFSFWFLAFRDLRKKILKIFIIFTVFTILVFAPLGLYFIENPQDFFGRTTQISILSSPTPIKDLGINILKTAGMFNFSGDWNWRHNIAGKPLLFWPVGILFIIGFILGIRQLFKFQIPNSKFQINSKHQIQIGFGILFTWLAVSALPVVISNEGLPHALRAILMAPPVFILAGIGGIWLYEKLLTKMQKDTKVRKFILVTSYLLLVTLIFEAYTTYFILWGQNPNTAGAFNQEYVRLGKELRELPKELPKYVVVEASGVDVRGMPMPTQTVMFLTDTFTPDKQKAKNLYYIFPDELEKVDQNVSYVVYLK
ncbi:MAG: glycosyltransferase family 39 protein [Candidatus Paceibacterota bacterium]